jgi:hypothetical protein
MEAPLISEEEKNAKEENPGLHQAQPRVPRGVLTGVNGQVNQSYDGSVEASRVTIVEEDWATGLCDCCDSPTKRCLYVFYVLCLACITNAVESRKHTDTCRSNTCFLCSLFF